MEEDKKIEVMPKQVSALNTYWLVQYLRENHAAIDIEALLRQIAASSPCYVENLYSGEIEAVGLGHLENPRYWFSHSFVKTLHDLLLEKIPDPRLGYKIGSTMYKTQPLIRTTIGLSLLGTHGVANRAAAEARKYNRTKQYLVQKLEKGYVEIRIVHDPGIVINDFTMQWNAGCFAAYARLAGATDITVDLRCIDPGPRSEDEEARAIWDFYIRYQEPQLLVRLARGITSCLPWIRKLTEDAEAIEAEHQEQILYRDRIIEERTAKLLNIQQRLIDEERQVIENKLKNISRELANTEEWERRAIAEDLHDSVTQLLALSLSKVKSARRKNLQVEELEEIAEHLDQALTELRSLTFQISPPVLYDFGLEAALDWLVEDINQRHGMSLVFCNLAENMPDIGHEQRVTLYRAIRELIINIIKHGNTTHGQVLLRQEDELFIAEVEDEGRGFDLQKMNCGFGLFTVRDRLEHLSGNLSVDSIPGEGTFIRIMVPLEALGSVEGQHDAVPLEIPKNPSLSLKN